MFIWPAFMLRKYLKGRSATFVFAFCVTFQTVLINTVVIMLGLLHLLNAWVIRSLFYIPFLIEAVRRLGWGKSEVRKLVHLFNGTYGLKMFCHDVLCNIGRRIRGFLNSIRRRFHAHWLEYGSLLVIIVYGMIYFSWGAFQNYSYSAGDIYVHNEWVYGLVQGKVFIGGIYPEGMHSFIYGMHTLFGIRIYSCMLYLQLIHIAVFLLAVYVFLKEVFCWKYTPMFVLTAFLTLDVLNGDAVFSMSRLQWTLPQEFGMPTVFLCAAFFLRYLSSDNKMMFRGKQTKGFWDENIVIFALTLASSFAIHFYATIMAFFLCMAFVPMHLKKLFSGKRFVPLAAAAIVGMAVAALPMAGAYITGVPLEGSLRWAMSIIDGSNGEQDNARPQEKTESSHHHLRDSVKKKSQTLYYEGYLGLFQAERARIILRAAALALLFWIGYRIYVGILKWIFREKERSTRPDYYDGYPSLVLASFIYVVMFCGSGLGLPILIDFIRLYALNQLLALAVVGISFDIVFSLLRLFLWESGLQVISIGVVAGIYALVVMTGNFHGFLFVHLTRLNGAVLTTHSITETMPPYSFTIVSPTDELYQQIQYGWHEELIDFANRVQEEEYTLPTEHIFIFVEKTPIRYAQYHLASGPEWLAQEKYLNYYGFTYASQSPEYVSSELISSENLGEDKRYFELSHNAYAVLSTRTLLESYVYKWCQEFSELYQGELQTYYEDDQFICYYIRQNPQSLYQLGILYQEEEK